MTLSGKKVKSTLRGWDTLCTCASLRRAARRLGVVSGTRGPPNACASPAAHSDVRHPGKAVHVKLCALCISVAAAVVGHLAGGTANKNRDGSLNLRFNYLPADLASTTIQVREPRAKDEAEGAQAGAAG